MEPKSEMVSVIIPVYNAAPFLKRCMDSVRNNTYQNLEIICVNDGSRDNSLEILKDYQKMDERVVVIDQPNGGVSAARNRGLERAGGGYIAFVDSDDWVHPQCFELLRTALKDTGADISSCDRIETAQWKMDDTEQELVGVRVVDTFEFETFHVWGKLFRRQIVDGLKFAENIKFGEDTVFATIASQKAKKITAIENKLYYYFSNIDSAVHTLEHDMYLAGCELMEDAKKKIIC